MNTALREYVQRTKRLQAAQRLAERGAQGEFDEAAAAHETAKQAWRNT